MDGCHETYENLAKLLMAFTLFVVADALALGFLIADKNKAIAVVSKERMGISYLQSLRPLRELIPSTGGSARLRRPPRPWRRSRPPSIWR